MNTQEKFTAAMRELAEARDLDLVVEHDYANAGYFCFQPRASFEAILRFPFSFRTGRSSFCEGLGAPNPLGRREGGGAWSAVRGADHDLVIARVAELLDAEAVAPSVRLALAG